MISIDDSTQIAETLFGIQATQSIRLPGENDFNFHIQDSQGREFLLKISHPEETETNLFIQNEALNWLKTSPQLFNFPQLQSSLSNHSLEYFNGNFVRLFTFVPGVLLAKTLYHSDDLLEHLGQQIAKLTMALADFKNPNAKRYFKWDLMQAIWMKPELDIIENEEELSCLTYFLKLFESQVIPNASSLRQSIIHGDLNNFNILVSNPCFGNYQVTGFIDFGDVIQSATVCELAIAIAYALLDKPNPLETASAIIKGYHKVFPLLDNEINLLFELIGIRLCISVLHSALRKKERPNEPYLSISEQSAWQALKQLKNINPEVAKEVFYKACKKANLHKIRNQRFGKNLGLSYNSPLQFVKGQGAYLYDQNARPFLDCINNVCHVGHCHPKVVEAGQKQMAELNTNTRYLHHYLGRYAEQLLAKLPSSLEVCYFVCSGSEANELALRLAQTHTKQNQTLVMDHSYHGNTSKLIEISPYKFNGPGGNGQSPVVQVLPLPKTPQDYDVINPNTGAFICETLLSCGGQIILPDTYLKSIYAAVRSIGGVCIADEVQIGLGRVGSHFWGFETQDLIPDIVTLGKPLGNGYPMGAVITTRAIAESFSNGMEYFNTFGGNPVACAIGLSVLDVIAEEGLQEQALKTGNYLKQKLTELQTKYSIIKEVRGLGLFLGVELVEQHDLPASIKDIANFLINQMKEKGVLLSLDGPLHNVIKIKPPLVFSKENADCVVHHLDTVLNGL